MGLTFSRLFERMVRNLSVYSSSLLLGWGGGRRRGAMVGWLAMERASPRRKRDRIIPCLWDINESLQFERTEGTNCILGEILRGGGGIFSMWDPCWLLWNPFTALSPPPPMSPTPQPKYTLSLLNRLIVHMMCLSSWFFPWYLISFWYFIHPSSLYPITSVRKERNAYSYGRSWCRR